MTTIKARCPACDEVEIPDVEVWLQVCRNVPSLSQFGFRCPACHLPVTKPADNRVISLLLSAGVCTCGHRHRARMGEHFAISYAYKCDECPCAPEDWTAA